MACRGVFFALSPDQTSRLLAAADDDFLVRSIVEEIEEQWDEASLCEVDKAWDAMHRALTIDPDDDPVLAKVVLGGRQLYSGDEFIISFLSSTDVRAVADAIEDIDELDMNDRYYRINADAYGMPLSKDDAEYTLAYFEEAKSFFENAASKNCAAIFSVDQ